MKAHLIAAFGGLPDLAPRLVLGLVQSCIVPQGAGYLMAVAFCFARAMLTESSTRNAFPIALLKTLVQRVQS